MNKSFTDYLSSSNAQFNTDSIIKKKHIIPKNIDFFPNNDNVYHCFQVVRLWENLLQSSADNDKLNILYENDQESNSPKYKSIAPSPEQINSAGNNQFHYKRSDYKLYPVLGDFNEKRALLGLRVLAEKNPNIKVIVPNGVGPLNSRNSTDFIIIDKRKAEPKVHFLDIKSDSNLTNKIFSEDQHSLLFSPNGKHFSSEKNRINSNMVFQLNELLENRSKSDFESEYSKAILQKVEDFEKKLTNSKEAFNHDEEISNFIELTDTAEAKKLENELTVEIKKLKKNFNQFQ